MTDTPQVMSGDSFAVFDPLEQFTDAGNGGFKIDISEIPSGHRSSLNTDWFESLHVSSKPGSTSGTIIRMPLRTTKSRLGDEKINPTQIQKLLEDFFGEEIDVVLLFLSHVKCVEVYTIEEGDSKACFAFSATVAQNITDADGAFTTSLRTVTSSSPGAANISQTWRVFNASYDKQESADILSHQLGYPVLSRMEKEKMTPEVALAIPISQLTISPLHGRLFAYFPLPLYTGFPCHIHGLFSLDSSRQNLRNSGEKGMVTESVDRCVVSVLPI